MLEENSKKTPLESYFFPMMVSEIPQKDDSNEEILKRWKKFDSLSERNRNILISENTGMIIKKISDSFSLEPDFSREISRIVRDVFFGLIQKESLSEKIAEKISVLKTTECQQIARTITERIIQNESIDQAISANIIKLPFSEALEKFPEIEDQLITEEKISVSNFPDPVRPSIKNWLSNYTYTLGYGSHGSIERGNFIFQNKNAQNLTSSEREKLSYILKANDENSVIMINSDLKQLLFPEKEIPKIKPAFEQKKGTLPVEKKSLDFKKKVPQQNTDLKLKEASSSENKIKFSSPQRMPFEKQALKPQINPKSPQPMRISPQNFRNTDNNKTNNIINLKKN